LHRPVLLRQYLEPYVSHLIFAAVSGQYESGWMIRIARIRRGVVICNAHLHRRSLRERNRAAVVVYRWPVDVPIGDADQPAAATVRKHGPGLYQLSQIVRVWIDRQQIHV